jgi:hypothetical protein
MAAETDGLKKNPGLRALAVRGIRIGLRNVRGDVALDEHELFAAAPGIDAPAEGAGR